MDGKSYAGKPAEGNHQHGVSPQEARDVVAYWASLGTIGVLDEVDRFDLRDPNDQEQWR